MAVFSDPGRLLTVSVGCVFILFGVWSIASGVRGIFTKLRENREWKESVQRMKDRKAQQ